MTRVLSIEGMREQLDAIDEEFGDERAFVVGETFVGDFDITAAGEDGEHPSIGHIGYHSSAFDDPGDVEGLLYSNHTLFGTILVKREYLSDTAKEMVEGGESE